MGMAKPVPVCACCYTDLRGDEDTPWLRGHEPEWLRALQAALADATKRAEAAEKSHEMVRNEIGLLEYVIGEAERQAEAVEKERDAATVRADTLAAHLAQVDGKHPA